MSQYRGSGYRGPADRSRSPPRFADRRPSTASIFDGRHSGPSSSRTASDTPRGPRSQLDGPPARGPPPSGLGSAAAPRSLRDAPPLGASDRGRPFRERDYPDRRERSPPLRERSPPRKFNEPRDFPPRDIDTRTARRSSRDGPPSAGSNYSDNPGFGSGSSFRGGFAGRGRGRGDSFFDRSGGRGGRRAFDDRSDRPDLFRQRERSPPPRYGRDLSRDGRELDRRDDRRYERREDDRRSDWLDRERDLDRDRTARRDAPPGRLESRLSTDSVASANAGHPPSAAPPINPERLAIIESSGADTSIRRPSSSQATPSAARRDPPSETPAYLNGRAETTANKYGSRGSSPPTQAPPVPAFSFSVAPTSAGNQSSQAVRSEIETGPAEEHANAERPTQEERPAPPANAPTAPKAAPSAPKAHHASPPPSAPKAPRALELDTTIPPSNRLQGVRSMESLAGPSAPARADTFPSTVPTSPGSSRHTLSHLSQPISPNPPTAPRFGDFSAPTGPRATRASPAQASVSPRPTFASPRSDVGAFQQQPPFARGQTPPPSAPSGPRRQSFSVSPKVPNSNIPTAPKASRVPPLAPRAGERGLPPQARPGERSAGGAPFAPPSGPRGLQWNQWRRPGAPVYGEKLGPSVPAKRDANGDEKERQGFSGAAASTAESQEKDDDIVSRQASVSEVSGSTKDAQEDKMDVDSAPARRKSGAAEGHSARQSFFGKTIEKSEDEIVSSSDEDELDEEEDATLLEAKHARKERELKSQMFDLSSRNYRATSPLESIARLARLSFQDLEKINAQRDEDMDVDHHETEPNRLAPPAVQSSESDEGPEIMTPHGDDNKNVAIRPLEAAPDGIRRLRRRSPEPIRLPYLVKDEKVAPLHETNEFQDNIQSLEEIETEMLDAVKEEIQDEMELEEDAEASFEELYRQWREECEILDREKEEQERLERQLSAEPGPDFEIPAAVPGNLVGEGRRHKFASEYDINMVIKQSEETARIEQEKMDREARKKEADMEKEARLPDQQTQTAIARSLIIDENRLRDPTSLTLVFSYEPPPNNFTEAEQQIFIAAFKDTPKKWGEIASLLPNRTYKDCIHHYYANKWDGRFRDNRAKKFKGGRRGRGGKASRPSRGSALMADLNRSEDIVQGTGDSASGRPKRAAAPTTFGEREIESKGTLVGQSPVKKQAQGSKEDTGGEKPAKKPRRTGESKPGRKGNKSQLAALAAAPAMAPNKPLAPGMPTKEEADRAQHLQDASLLASLQGGHPGAMRPEQQMVFNQEGFIPQPAMPEEVDRPKQAPQAAKPAASSYWSVPEQTDFFKYISYFGTDFGAIASHMGTKTQTMIKNHYQRNIDGGGRADLEEAANKANERRERGEDIGPPPTPTPIIRKNGSKVYADYSQSNPPRAIAPQATDMPDAEEATIHSAVPKHSSPPQAQAQAKPRFTSSAQGTPIPAHRAVPSPLPTTAPTPAAVPPAMPTAPHSRGLGHPLGSRLGFLTEQRSEPRPAIPTSGFRFGQEQPPSLSRPQPQPQQQQVMARTPSGNPLDPAYLAGLQQEQERALRLAGAESEARGEHIPGRPLPGQNPHAHGSPSNHPVAAPFMDHKPILEERRPTPPRNAYATPGGSRPPLFGTSSTPAAAPLAVTPLSSIHRGPYHASPPKQDPLRPGSVSGSTPAPSHQGANPFTSNPPPAAPGPAATPAPEREPPKRSNLLSILNNEEPSEPKPAPKRDSLPSAPTRVASPAPSTFPSSSTPQPLSGIPPSRREQFGQSSLAGQGPLQRTSFGQGSSTPAPTLKHESSAGGGSSMQQPPKQDLHWQSRVFGHSNQPSPPTNPLSIERDGRAPFYPHRSSMLGGLNQPGRANPSPPPHALHSRTPSLSAQQANAPPPRESRSVLGGPPPSAQSLHSNPYAAQQQQHLPPYSQAPQAQNRAHHSHNTSIGDRPSYLPFGHTGSTSREEAMRREDEIARAQQQQRERDREREEQMRFEAIQLERQRAHEQHIYAHRQQEAEMERRRMDEAAYAAARPPAGHQPLHHAPPYGSPFGAPGPGRGPSLREQSTREAEQMMADQRMFQEREERRRRDQQPGPPPPQGYRDGPGDPMMRRPDEYLSRRTTPYGGQPSYPPPPRR